MVKKIGFITEGATELEILRSSAFKEMLKNLDLESVGEFDAMGRDNLINKTDRIESFLKIFRDKDAEKIFILTDLESEPCISYYKNRIYNYSSKIIIIVVVKAIESWLLSDSETLSNLLKKNFTFNNPEETNNLPFNTLQDIFLQETGRGLGSSKSKIRIMRRFIRNGFSLDKASKHPNCSSVKYFIKKLEEFSKE